jgi:O-antigen ligase
LILTIMALVVATPLLQLIPLPPALWSGLPGQGPRLVALRLAGVEPPWLPMSLAPRETASAALALIPPAAMLMGSLCLTADQVRRLGGLWIILAVAGLGLGMAQIADPAGGLAYPYRTTNLGSLVGLFANRNHEAGFLLALPPFAAALAVREIPRARPEARGGALAPGQWLAGLFILISVIALGAIKSRAGVILAAPAIIAAIAIVWRASSRRAGRGAIAGVSAAAIIAISVVAAFGLTPIVSRFAPQSDGEFRLEAWPHVVDAAKSFLPLGSGVGSFDRVFEAAEPLVLVRPTYFNHAHNDYLELWLETGWVGVAIFSLFLVWLAIATLRAWRGGSDLARASSAAILLLMAESAVDYPLRTETLAVLFAFCCGTLASRGEARP